MAKDNDDIGLDELFADRFGDRREGLYSEAKWNSFEKILDKELPVRNNNSRIAILLLTLVGIGVGGYLLLPQDAPVYTPVSGLAASEQLKDNAVINQKGAETKPVDAISKINITTNAPALKETQSESPAYSPNEPPATKTKSTRAAKNKGVLTHKPETTQPTGIAVESNFAETTQLFTVKSESPDQIVEKQPAVKLENNTEIVEEKQETAALSRFQKRLSVWDDTSTIEHFKKLETLIENKKPKAAKHNLYAIGGINGANGYSNSGRTAKFTGDLFAGISYQKILSPKFALSISAIYLSKSGHKLRQENEKITFFLDKKIEKDMIETQAIEYFQFPLIATYNIRKRHQISGGAYVASLYATRSEFKETETDARGTKTDSKKDVDGFTSGISPLDYGLLAGYDYRLSNKASVGIYYQFGLPDVTLEEVYGEEEKDKSRNLQLVFKYLLFNY